MMIDPPIGELLQKVDCRYTLADRHPRNEAARDRD